MPDENLRSNDRQDPLESWLSGMEAYRDYLGESARARSAGDWLEAYGRFLGRCLALAAAYAEAFRSRPPE